jgi:hypothetical protein
MSDVLQTIPKTLDKRTFLDNTNRMTKPLPMPTQLRRDGWTPEGQQRFLDELAMTGSPSRAAVAAGRSVQSAYKLRACAGVAAFRDGWAAAIAACMLQVRDQAVDRAFNWHVAPIMKLAARSASVRSSIMACCCR